MSDLILVPAPAPVLPPPSLPVAPPPAPDRLILDIESRSACDLKKCGVHVYAEHPTTSITHVGWKLGKGPTAVWQPAKRPMPAELFAALIDRSVILVAHNAGFEHALLNGPPGRAVGMPDLSDRPRWSCTASRAAQLCLPRELGKLSVALDLRTKKDSAGHKLMLTVSKPKRDSTWWDDDDRMERMERYCAGDVEAEHELDRLLPELTGYERKVWEVTELTNGRGVLVDKVLLLDQLAPLVNATLVQVNARISELTDGEVPKVSNHPALLKWLNGRGYETDSTDKFAILDLLDRDDLDDTTREVLELRRDAGGSSISKIPAIGRHLSADGRLRGALIYAGATATARWSSHGAQLQNLPRPDDKLKLHIPSILRDLALNPTPAEIEALHGPPLKVVAELLRPVFVAALGNRLVSGDFSQIEARGLAWFAGEERKLAAFRAYDAGTGPDIYCVAASGMFGRTIAKGDPERQPGKIVELAGGYGGGIKAIKKTARKFNLKWSDEKCAEYRDRWRAANPNIVNFWAALENAAFQCVATRQDQAVGRVRFAMRRKNLTMQLPSGRQLTYWYVSIKEAELPWGDLAHQVHYWAENSYTRKWQEHKLYGGLLTENLVQATCRDLLADAFLRAEQLNPVLTVHDEIVCEIDHPDAVNILRRIMQTIPQWAHGLPVAADVKAGERYMK
jgi:DNA polymerase bacteriophage-type